MFITKQREFLLCRQIRQVGDSEGSASGWILWYWFQVFSVALYIKQEGNYLNENRERSYAYLNFPPLPQLASEMAYRIDTFYPGQTILSCILYYPWRWVVGQMHSQGI